MGIGIDESGKFYVISGPPSARHCHAGPFEREKDCRSKARAMGLNGPLVRLAGSTVVGGVALAALVKARIDEVTTPQPNPFLSSVFDMNARDAAAHIKAAEHNDVDRAWLVAAERKRAKPRVTVLRALGVEV